MSRYRNDLPQMNGRRFLTDSGLETTLLFLDGFDLPLFAAFQLLRDEAGAARMDRYFREHAALARESGAGFVLESVTWRASWDWAKQLGYSREELAQANRQAMAMLAQVRDDMETPEFPMVISGCVGPRGDGYDPSWQMTADEAEAYHTGQVSTLAGTEADMISAVTMTHEGEAVGIVRASARAGLPSVVSFTVEIDGCLPTGQPLSEAVEAVDAATDGAPAYYMINCAHPEHFDHVLEDDAAWTRRIRGIRANASRMSHAELDNAEDLDAGNPEELGRQYAALRKLLPNLMVMGGCCGTDIRHVEAMNRAWVA